MSITVGINGFGRIGRNILRQSLLRTDTPQAVNICAINDLTNASTLAHLLKYDSIHGTLQYEVSTEGDDILVVNGKKIKITAEKDPAQLKWSDSKCDLVLECTGIFESKDKASLHLKGGAKKVIISAPSPDPDITIAYGVNHHEYNHEKHTIISNASCTTNCLAPVAKVLHENFTIVRGTMTTIHSYTNDQRILDLPHKDLRRARAANLSMIPTTTGAAKAVGLVIPELKGKVDGFAIRVPTPDVSVVDFVAELKQEVTKEKVNACLKKASETTLKGILSYTELPLVSIDFTGNVNSSIIDASLTMVIQNSLVKVVAWYDNEMGFSSRMVDMCCVVGEKL
jgi:glyceraldehyde 3-phosphate dehydrogenase